VAVLARNSFGEEGARSHGERNSASLYRGSPSGVQGQSPWSEGGGEAEALLIFVRSMEAANLPTFLKFENAKKSDICVIFAKNYGWPRNGVGEGMEPPARA